MKEERLLNKTLDLINDESTNEAYSFLVANKNALETMSSQVYNFLYCLAATSGKKEESIAWLEEAVITKGLWFRPEVFEDEDLDTIRDDFRFKKCCGKSEERYLEALSHAKTICTWSKKTKSRLILSLHGNQQNNEISKEHWDFLRYDDYQLEYIQSKELDSFQLYRWEDEGTGPIQLQETIDMIEWDSYDNKILCGFSSGCNTILRAIRDRGVNCNKIILQSPWIPVIENNSDHLFRELKNSGIEVFLICGEADDDCFTLCKLFEAKAHEFGLDCKVLFLEGLGHEYPENFNELIRGILL